MFVFRSQLPLKLMVVQERQDWFGALQQLLDRPAPSGGCGDQVGLCLTSPSDHLMPAKTSYMVQLSLLDKAQWASMTAENQIAQGFFLFEICATDPRSDVRQLVEVSHLGGRIVAAGSSALLPYRLCFRHAGCVDLVTSFFELTRVERMIRLANWHQPYEYRDWKSLIVDRLPWQSVKGPTLP